MTLQRERISICKIGGYQLPNPTYNYICRETQRLLLQLKPDKCISGMALGFDQYAAAVCVKLGIPFIAAIPFIGQEKMWPAQSQKGYHLLLKHASEMVIISDGEYSPQKMQIRNEYMSNRADAIIACFNGDVSGGTYNCMEWAKSKNKPIHIIDPRKAI